MELELDELELLFFEDTTLLYEPWLDNASKALEEMIQKDFDEKATSQSVLDWTLTDVQWDPVVNWLQRSIETMRSNIPHYVLLWLACDKVHGFWLRHREKKLDSRDNWKKFSWGLRARLGATTSLLPEELWLLNPNIISLFSNPLIFRINPKVKLLATGTIDSWKEQEVSWKRSWEVLGYPIQFSELERLIRLMQTIDRLVEKEKDKEPLMQEWRKRRGKDNLSQLVFTEEQGRLFELVPMLASEKQCNDFDSTEMLVALCSYMTDFWKAIHEFEKINQVYLHFTKHSEQGLGADIQFY